MQKLANISVIEGLQGAQHDRMGCPNMSVFNDAAERAAVENVRISMGGKEIDLNNPNSVPIIKGAFEQTSPAGTFSGFDAHSIIKELEDIEQIAEQQVRRIEADTTITPQEKKRKKARTISDKQVEFVKGKNEIEQQHAKYNVEVESDFPPLNARVVLPQ